MQVQRAYVPAKGCRCSGLLVTEVKDMSSSILRKLLPGLVGSVFVATVTFAPAGAQQQQQQQRPNIVIIWGDDIGQSDISAYSRGLMGFKTPNIDRLATEGILFTDYYA